MVTSGIVLGLGAGGAALAAGLDLGAVPWTVGAIVGGAIPWLIVDSARVERARAINRGLPYAIDMMSLSMSAGLDFPSSVHQVVEKAKANEALKEELSYFLQQLQLGTTRVHALKEMTRRTPIDCVFEFAQALTQAEERGNPVAAVLEVQAASSRVRRSNLAEKAAASMKAKMVLPSAIMVALGLVLVAVPSSMMIDSLSKKMMGLL
jgi:tight adherence protein C